MMMKPRLANTILLFFESFGTYPTFKDLFNSFIEIARYVACLLDHDRACAIQLLIHQPVTSQYTRIRFLTNNGIWSAQEWITTDLGNNVIGY